MTSAFTGYQQSLPYTAAKDRAISAVGMVHKALAVAESGVVLGTGGNLDCSVAAGTTLNVGSGVAMINNYKFVSSVDRMVVVAASTGSARRDLIIARVYDTENGDATSKSEIEVVQGTSTSDPTTPANSLILWQANIAAGGTVTVTDRRKFTAASGGVKQVLQISDITYADVAPGCHAYDLATQRTYRRDLNSLVPVGSGTPITYTPSWTGDGGNPTPSSSTGRYTVENGVCMVWIRIVTASNGGGKGILRVGLPLSAKAGVQTVIIPARLSIANYSNYLGFMEIAAGNLSCPVMFPKSENVAGMTWWQSCDNAGTSGTGIPNIPGSYSVTTGSFIEIHGSYFV